MKKEKAIRCAAFLVLVVGALLFTSCASIVNGKTQEISINSQPQGAKVTVDDKPSGVTPTKIEMARKTSHRVEISHPGYRTQEFTIEPKFNGMTVGNILAGGIIGMAVDGSTGASNKLHPDKIEAVLKKR